MIGYLQNIEGITLANEYFRQVLYTGQYAQLVVKPLKLYTIYSPPHHKDGTVHKTKQAAEMDTTLHKQ